MKQARGQAATEYLIILAVLLMAALVAIAVSGGFRDTGRDISETDSAAYWAGAEIGIAQYGMAAGRNSTIVFRNNRNFPIRLISASFGQVPYGLGNYAIGPGQLSEQISIGATCGAAAGEIFSIPVSITYEDTQYGAVRTFTGDAPLIGTCQ